MTMTTTRRPYPRSLQVHYTNDQQYRECLRVVSGAESLGIVPHGTEGVDEVTRDEWDFDADAMTDLLDTVYDATSKVPAFQSLYLRAAAKMMSDDPEIGLAVLFSYDYFSLFHACVCELLNGGSQSMAMTVLEQKLTPRRA
jgi:hypothetical protein